MFREFRRCVPPLGQYLHWGVHPITRDPTNLSLFHTPPAALFAMDHVAELDDSERVLTIRQKTWAGNLDLVLSDFPKANKLR